MTVGHLIMAFQVQAADSTSTVVCGRKAPLAPTPAGQPCVPARAGCRRWMDAGRKWRWERERGQGRWQRRACSHTPFGCTVGQVVLLLLRARRVLLVARQVISLSHLTQLTISVKSITLIS